MCDYSLFCFCCFLVQYIHVSRSSSRWDFHFHSYVLTIYVSLYWILELVVFYSLVWRGYIRKVSVQLVQIFFTRLQYWWYFMQRTKKIEEKKIKTREQNKGRKNKTLLSSPIHLAHHRSAVAPLLLRCCTAISMLSLCCRSAVAPLSHRYRSAVAPPLSLLLSLRSRTAIAPPSRRCGTATPSAQRGYK